MQIETPVPDRYVRKSSIYHVARLLFSCAVVVAPMVAFTITILVVLFSNLVDLSYCPSSQLCSYAETIRANDTEYYVDFPVGRLAFIASLSSTFSLALVAAVMTMYAYVVAAQMLNLSRGSVGGCDSPSPHETSTIIRCLNAEIIPLCELVVRGSQQLLRLDSQRNSESRSKPNRVLRLCCLVLFLGVCGSISIQAADTYLHIVIEAVNIERLIQTTSEDLSFSRRLAPWYFDDPRDGVLQRSIAFSRNYLHNGIDNVTWYDGSAQLTIANQSSYLYAAEKVASYVLNYTDPTGRSYAIVRPANIDPSFDWTGTGYAISTQCTGVPQNDCTAQTPLGNRTVLQCAGDGVYPNVTIGESDSGLKTWTLDWSKGWVEDQPFDRPLRYEGTDLLPTGEPRYRWDQNLTLEDGNSMFRNPWHWFAKVAILGERSELPQAFSDSPLVLKYNTTGGRAVIPFIFMKCKTSVYDTVHTVARGRLVSVNATLSNGSVAGLVSQMSVEEMGAMAAGHNTALVEANGNRTTPEAFITNLEQSMNKALSVPLVVHTVPERVLYAHRRVTTVITRLPKAALWLLVVANSSFAVLGLVIAIIALKAASPRTHQAQVRLSTSGLAAQLFDSLYARREAKHDAELFHQKNTSVVCTDTTRVRMQSTSLGGAEFVTDDRASKLEEEDGEFGLRLRFTHSL